MREKATCEKCQRPFEYEWRGKSRRVCDGCKAALIRSSVRRIKSGRGSTTHARTLDSNKVVFEDDSVGESRLNGGVLEAVAAMSRNQVATALQVSYESVRTGEERGLLKLRRHPELMKLWLRYRAEGGGVPLREDAGERLLKFQLQVARWYQFAEALGKEGLKEEQAECLKMIEQFQLKLGEAFK